MEIWATSWHWYVSTEKQSSMNSRYHHHHHTHNCCHRRCCCFLHSRTPRPSSGITQHSTQWQTTITSSCKPVANACMHSARHPLWPDPTAVLSPHCCCCWHSSTAVHASARSHRSLPPRTPCTCSSAAPSHSTARKDDPLTPSLANPCDQTMCPQYSTSVLARHGDHHRRGLTSPQRTQISIKPSPLPTHHLL